jgi:hypothetical protein
MSVSNYKRTRKTNIDMKSPKFLQRVSVIGYQYDVYDEVDTNKRWTEAVFKITRKSQELAHFPGCKACGYAFLVLITVALWLLLLLPLLKGWKEEFVSIWRGCTPCDRWWRQPLTDRPAPSFHPLVTADAMFSNYPRQMCCLPDTRVGGKEMPRLVWQVCWDSV